MILAERVKLPITSKIIWGTIVTLSLFALGFAFETIIASILLAIIPLVITILVVRNTIIFNNDYTAPIDIDYEKHKIILNEKRYCLELNYDEFLYAKGKNKRYFRILGNIISWGTYNYGTVKIVFFNKETNKKESFKLTAIHNPVEASQKINQHLENIKDL